MQATRARWGALLGVLLVVLATAPAHGQPARPRASATLAPGLAHQVWSVAGSSARVHVARRDAGSPVRLQLVQAHDALTGGLETTTSMCRRTPGCQVAVNGDFYTGGGPVGGVVVGGRMLRSPRPDHEQLSLEPLRATTAGLGEGGWSAQVTPEGRQPLAVDGVNVPLGPGRLVLFTDRYGAATPACTCLEVELAEGPVAAGSLDRAAPMTIVGRREGATPLRPGVAVLAGEGAAADQLSRLLSGPAALTVSVTVSQPTTHNLGAHPVLLREGRPQPYDESDPMLAEEHPRTVVAWDAQGTTWLVTADGRRPNGPGLTAAQVLALVQQLGATDAVLLDGGGSTTFVRRGEVVNSPSDRRERPVANAVLLTWSAPPAPPPPPPPAAPVVAEQASAPQQVAAPVVAPVTAPVAAAPTPAAPPPAAQVREPVAFAPPAVAGEAVVSVEPPAAPAAAGADPPTRVAPVAAAARPEPAPAWPVPVAALICLVAWGCWLRGVLMWVPGDVTARRVKK